MSTITSCMNNRCIYLITCGRTTKHYECIQGFEEPEYCERLLNDIDEDD